MAADFVVNIMSMFLDYVRVPSMVSLIHCLAKRLLFSKREREKEYLQFGK